MSCRIKYRKVATKCKANCCTSLIIKNTTQGEEAFLVDLLENRIPPGVDEVTYVKTVFFQQLQLIL
jgi:aconitase B